jgi:peptidoglycan/xylan/chitin deacetylase (PgdA/CDA1 family)
MMVLCYHGFSFKDEHLFRPKLFMSPDLFERRMRWLKKAGYTSIVASEALDRARAGKLRNTELVITIDDGFHGVSALAFPILQRFGFTATVYVTTYYVTHNHPIFRIAIQYLFWKTRRDSVMVDDLIPGCRSKSATKGADSEATLWKIIEFGEAMKDEPARVSLTRELANRLDVDFDELAASRRLTLMNEAEIRALADANFDIQLHTHRHVLPAERFAAKREIDDNRAVLAPLTPRSLNHLCYPSGIWTRDHWPLLKLEGIETATTCEPGFVSRATPALAWPRLLDSQSLSDISFQAELSGLSDILRRTLARTASKNRSPNE